MNKAINLIRNRTIAAYFSKRQFFLAITACLLPTLPLNANALGDSTFRVTATTVDSVLRIKDNETFYEIGSVTDDIRSYLQFSQPLGIGRDPILSLRNFGFLHIITNPRGNSLSAHDIRLNNTPMNDPFSGRVLWNVLSGVDNLISDQACGLTTPDSWLGSSDGYRYMRMGELISEKRYFASYSYSNKSNGNMVKFSMSDRVGEKWSYDVAGKFSWGRDPFFDGVFGRRLTSSGSVNYQANNNNLFSVGYVINLGEGGLRSYVTDEVFGLAQDAGMKHWWGYNPNVGFQDGRQRNSSTRSNTTAGISLRHDFSKEFFTNREISLSTGITYAYDRRGYASLTRYDAPNPYPDYYGYLPSNFDNPAQADAIRQQWMTDEATRGIDWHRLYQTNYAQPTSPNGRRSRYAVQDEISRNSLLRFSSVLKLTINSYFSTWAALDMSMDNQRNFRVMDDLLGGDYWLDVDPYLLDDVFLGDQTNNDLRSPNRTVRAGDKFGYNYRLAYTGTDLSVGAKLNVEKFSAVVSLSFASGGVARNGFYEKENFSDRDSYGKSEVDFENGAKLKVSAMYLFGGYWTTGINLLTAKIMPTADQLFLSPMFRNTFVENPEKPSYTGIEVFLNARKTWGGFAFTAYAQMSTLGNSVINRYDQTSGKYSHHVISGQKTTSLGIDASLEVNAGPRVKLAGVLMIGDFRYSSDQFSKQYDEKTGDLLIEKERIHMEGLKIPDAPSVAVSGSVSYRPVSTLVLDLGATYTAERYARMDIMRRTDRYLATASSETIREQIQEQTPLPAHIVTEFSVGYGWYSPRGHSLWLRASVSNLTNERIVRSGYEQSRLIRNGRNSYEPYPIKTLYDYPRTFFVTIMYSF